MHVSQVVEHMSAVLLLVLSLSLPPIAVAALTGVLVSLVQALTQIQEQTLSFAIKLLAVSFAIYWTAATTGEELYRFTQNSFQLIASIQGR
ncbi:MAG: type III secretion system export apparatus subunit SctS [Alphaproteobacteria bacterium GM202ARS2]|nr:type III secretion system export apparatus subunit SctS [Alphaproteobacteria bacterium GM202ARS2]